MYNKCNVTSYLFDPAQWDRLHIYNGVELNVLDLKPNLVKYLVKISFTIIHVCCNIILMFFKGTDVKVQTRL